LHVDAFAGFEHVIDHAVEAIRAKLRASGSEELAVFGLRPFASLGPHEHEQVEKLGEGGFVPRKAFHPGDLLTRYSAGDGRDRARCIRAD
jgi:hypothetical protein